MEFQTIKRNKNAVQKGMTYASFGLRQGWEDLYIDKYVAYRGITQFSRKGNARTGNLCQRQTWCFGRQG